MGGGRRGLADMEIKYRDRRSWPASGKAERIDLGRHQWLAAAERLDGQGDRAFARELPRTPAGSALFDCIFGASPFLAKCMVREQPFFRKVWERGPEECVDREIRRLRQLPPECDQRTAARLLRTTRHRVALAIALADISGHWGLEAVTGAQTDLAEASCSAAFRILLARLAKRGALLLPDKEDPEAGSGLIALGMGKLGGGELNFSSDIDLILLYDPEEFPARRSYEAPFLLMKLAQSFIGLLSEPTVDGMAFRVDLRLRPDPVSTPLVLSTKAALTYYEQRGQTWERAALIKARPVAADRKAGDAFLSKLEPFVWSQHLDFATVQELHDIKRRIDAQHQGGDIGSRGQNIKLGRGGIREIEFFTQSHQLVWGGNEPSLRTIATCEALRALTSSGHVPQSVTDALIDSYRYLRRVEHRIQMVADNQTHSLPSDPAEFEGLARFLGYRDGSAFDLDLTAKLRQVERQYESFFELPREMAVAGESSPLAAATQVEAAERLARMGFERPSRAAATVTKWREGAFPSASDPRALALLRSLVPSLVIAVCGTEDPDLALRRLDGLVQGIDDGVRAFTLLQANLNVMESVAEILVAAPAVGAVLARRPELLEELLDPAMDSWGPDRAKLKRELAEAIDGIGRAEDRLHRMAEWADRARFRLAAQLLYRSLDPVDAPRLVSDVADCLLEAILNSGHEDLTLKHGQVPGGRARIMARGRFAWRELAVGDLLDVDLLFEAPDGSRSAGPDQVPAAQYFASLAAQVHADLVRLSADGLLFSVPETLTAATSAMASSGVSRHSGSRPRSGSWRAVASVGREASDTKMRVPTEGAPPANDEQDVLAQEAVLRDLSRVLPAEAPSEDLESALGHIAQACQALVARSEIGGRSAAAVGPRKALAGIRDSHGVDSAEAASLLDAWVVATQVRSVERLLGRPVRSGDQIATRIAVPQIGAGEESAQEAVERVTSVIALGSKTAARLVPDVRRP
ncbi:MAG: hypothetical protein OXN89_07870 [Bryobacterales bacterium]|nr:hypothetical protein [Bryobacterales bacterium]